jgi:hypothetical protein
MGNINALPNTNTQQNNTCKICERVTKNDIIDYTFIDIDILCKTCKQKKIEYCILYEKYRFESCHGGC